MNAVTVTVTIPVRMFADRCEAATVLGDVADALATAAYDDAQRFSRHRLADITLSASGSEAPDEPVTGTVAEHVPVPS